MLRTWILAALVAVLLLGKPACAAELVITVQGDTGPGGEVGCALFAGPDGFPMHPEMARHVWVAAAASGTECRFKDVKPGDYAASASRDLNGNRKLDTNFLGIPTEPWGVSNNARPIMRAPRFSEAQFAVGEADMRIGVRIER